MEDLTMVRTIEYDGRNIALVQHRLFLCPNTLNK